jgi:hypothetical protein
MNAFPSGHTPFHVPADSAPPFEDEPLLCACSKRPRSSDQQNTNKQWRELNRRIEIASKSIEMRLHIVYPLLKPNLGRPDL